MADDQETEILQLNTYNMIPQIMFKISLETPMCLLLRWHNKETTMCT